MEKAPKKRDPVVNLGPTVARLQGIVTEELCNQVFRDVRTKERQRSLSLHTLFQFWTAVVVYAPPSLRSILGVASVGGDALIPKLDVAPASFFARSKTLDHEFFMQLYHSIVAQLANESEGSYAAQFADLRKHFRSVLIIDGSCLDKIAHRLKILHDVRSVVLPGCLTAVYDLFRGFATRLYFWKDAAMSEHKRAAEVIPTLPEGSLLLGDRLYCTIPMFLAIHAAKCFGLFRRNKNLKYRKISRLSRKRTPDGCLEDLLVEVGTGERLLRLRLIRLKVGRKTYEAMTDVLDPGVLSPETIVQLYPIRWQVERLFFDLKVVLNLKEFYAANPNAVAMQVYAAAAVHAVFRVAQADVAKELRLAPEEISPAKLFPRLAAAAYAVSMAEVLHREYQRQVPGEKLHRPAWDRVPFTKVRLSDIRRHPRNGRRKKRKYCKSRRNWKSFAAIPGAKRFLS